MPGRIPLTDSWMTLDARSCTLMHLTSSRSLLTKYLQCTVMTLVVAYRSTLLDDMLTFGLWIDIDNPETQTLDRIGLLLLHLKTA